MNGSAVKVAALVAALAFSGCSTTDSAETPTATGEASPTSVATTAASPESTTTDGASPATTSPTAGSTAGSGTPTASTVSVAESCQAVLADQQAALDAVVEYVRHPLSGDVRAGDLEAARDRLQADAARAPGELREHLQTQILVLSKLVEGLRTEEGIGEDATLNISQFRQAGKQITEICSRAQ